MLTQGRFLISYQVFDNIPVNNNGQTHVREILKDTQAFTFSYRTEQNKEVQTKIKEIIYNNLYDTILQNPGDLVSHSQHHKR